MKKSFLDDLARIVATPMPRRQAVRTIGSAFAMGAFRMLRPRSAAEPAFAKAECPPLVDQCLATKEKACCVKHGTTIHFTGCCGRPFWEDCCIGSDDDPDRPVPTSWCCPKGKCNGSYRASGGPCKPSGCSSDETKCGTACCKPGEFCGSPNRSLCCAAGDNVCVFATGGLCCKPGTKCCFNATRGVCCDVSQSCLNGTCACAKGTTQCGTTCCKKGEVCDNEKCCPKGKVNCGGDCCAKLTCCATAGGNTCCKQGELCVNIAGAPGNKKCCPTSRVAAIASAKAVVCCPQGSVDTGNGACCPPTIPNCCAATTCGKGTFCSLGQCVSI